MRELVDVGVSRPLLLQLPVIMGLMPGVKSLSQGRGELDARG